MTSPATHSAEGGRPVRIGVQLQPQHAEYDDVRRAADRAEELGVDVLFNWDHFYPLFGEPEGKHFECWTMLAAWAEQTSRVQFGRWSPATATAALSSSPTWRGPWTTSAVDG